MRGVERLDPESGDPRRRRVDVVDLRCAIERAARKHAARKHAARSHGRASDRHRVDPASLHAVGVATLGAAHAAVDRVANRLAREISDLPVADVARRGAAQGCDSG